MSKRDKKRGNRRQQIRPTSAADQSSQPETTTSSESAEQRRARQKKEWEDRKHRKELQGQLQVPLIGTTTIGSLVGGATSLVVVIGSIVGVFLLLSGGGGDSAPAETATRDPRIPPNSPIAKTVDISADDDGQSINPRFIPNAVTGEAGTVIEFKITNDGSVAHNLNVSGLDKEYGTRDDFVIDSLQPGEEATLLVKLDDPGTYPFRCDLHPEQQTGTLILS